METFAENAIEIINELHTERLDYTSEYIPLINAVQALAEYEETGLMPEEVEILKERLDRYEKAEADGHLVKSPCKVGDTIWTNYSISGWYMRESKRPYKLSVCFIGLNSSEDMGGGFVNVTYVDKQCMFQFDFSDFGKTVFLTKEEAEEKLNGVEEDG